MGSGFEILGIERVFMKPLPFLKRIVGSLLVFVIVPVQHPWREFKANALTVLFDDAFGIVKEVICVDETNVDLSIVGIASILLSREFLTHQPRVLGKVEEATEFVVAGFVGIEIVEACDVVQRRDRTTVIRWNAGMRVTDEEGEMELLQKLARDDGGIAILCSSCKGKGCLALVTDSIGAIWGSIWGANPTFLGMQRWRNFWWLRIWWYQVANHILDEESSPLSKRQ